MLLVTAFISYVGGFTRTYRVDLQQKKWLPFLKTLNVRPSLPLPFVRFCRSHSFTRFSRAHSHSLCRSPPSR